MVEEGATEKEKENKKEAIRAQTPKTSTSLEGTNSDSGATKGRDEKKKK